MEHDRPRILDVVLATCSMQRAFLADARHLRLGPDFKDVFVRFSLTCEQQDADFQLREKCRRRREIFIKKCTSTAAWPSSWEASSASLTNAVSLLDFNGRSLGNKLNSLFQDFCSYKYRLVAIIETSFTENYPDALLTFGLNFSIFRCDWHWHVGSFVMPQKIFPD